MTDKQDEPYQEQYQRYKSMIFWVRFSIYSPFIVMPIVLYFMQLGLNDGFAMMLIFLYLLLMGKIRLINSICPFCGEFFYKSQLGYLFKNSLALSATHCQHCKEPKTHQQTTK